MHTHCEYFVSSCEWIGSASFVKKVKNTFESTWPLKCGGFNVIDYGNITPSNSSFCMSFFFYENIPFCTLI